MIQNQTLAKFLALKRIKELVASYHEQSSKKQRVNSSLLLPFFAIIIAMLPSLGVYLEIKNKSQPFSLIFSGTALVAAIFLLRVAKIEFRPVKDWFKGFRLTHTAFGLSCIPFIFLLLIYPHAFYSIGGDVVDITAQNKESATPFYVALMQFILFTAFWAGLTEEFIYRGMLIGILRRMNVPFSQRKKDLIAITLASIIFGLVHIPSWGILLSSVCVFLGFGLGVAYIAISERILPLIVYHIVFDILSLLAAYFSYRL